jgi:predicted RecA/RadA family phage recombinase
MKAKFLAEDDMIDYTPGSDVAAGDVIVTNSIIGIATRAIASGVKGNLVVEGVCRVRKKQEALTAFATVYWDATGDPYNSTAGSGALTATSTNNTYFGFVITAAASTDEFVDVMLVKPKSVTVNSSLTLVIADPGASGAIPVTNGGNVPIVTATAETRTLAVPSYEGQQLLLYMKTDGGDAVITVAAAINQTGNNTITMNDAGDTILLVGIKVGSSLRWRTFFNDGCSLSTV